MLQLLQPIMGFDLCALHIRHPNRDDAVHEEQWVQFVARKIGLQLYSYAMELQRPHGNVRTGISRDRYEDVTKRIRFQMYKAVTQLPVRKHLQPMVVMGHHEDDTDENRLAELGKGNIVNVNGMDKISECLGVAVLRPLLALRKQAMYEYAALVCLPYMADSTPPWSRRGWIRRVRASNNLYWITKLLCVRQKTTITLRTSDQ